MTQLPPFDFSNKQPSELEQRRREIDNSLTTTYKGYDDPEVPMELLQELAAITGTLRRRTAGPPKAKPKAGKATKTSKVALGDLLDQI